MDWLLVPVTQIIEFITNGVYDLIIEAYAFLVIKLTLFYIESMIFSISFSWDVAKEVFQQLGITNALSQAWSYLDSETLSTLTFFGIPDVVNILTNALLTSYVLKFVPFSGK